MIRDLPLLLIIVWAGVLMIYLGRPEKATRRSCLEHASLWGLPLLIAGCWLVLQAGERWGWL